MTAPASILLRTIGIDRTSLTGIGTRAAFLSAVLETLRT
jgi:hypothetical protein